MKNLAKKTGGTCLCKSANLPLRVGPTAILGGGNGWGSVNATCWENNLPTFSHIALTVSFSSTLHGEHSTPLAALRSHSLKCFFSSWTALPPFDFLSSSITWNIASPSLLFPAKAPLQTRLVGFVLFNSQKSCSQQGKQLAILLLCVYTYLG